MNSRLDKYFVKYLDEYVFVELMPDYVKRERLDFMRGVPMPVKKQYMAGLSENRGIEFKYFTMGMVNIIGINPSFKYTPQYTNFLNFVNNNISASVTNIGINLAKSDMLDEACIVLRAALVIEPSNADALYNYMLVCRNLYNRSDDPDYTADFKMEVLESLLDLKELIPEFSMTYYFLGYAYINAGSYKEAHDTWEEFMRLSAPGKEQDEIKERLELIETPVRIEEGYKDIINGRWEEGLSILEDYRATDNMEWWPLPYYLGVGYNRTGRHREALTMLKKALEGNPSGAEIMAELIIANNALGDEVNAEKYRRKLELLKSGS